MEIYLDHNASAPLREEARLTVMEVLNSRIGNPSSIHRHGHRAKILLEEARESVARLIGGRPDEIVFTSGGTEANNLALFGAARPRGGGHLIVSPIEHSSVLEPVADLEREGFQVARVRPDGDGWVNPDALISAVTGRTFLVGLMHSSNELGTLQPVAEMGAALRGRGIHLHCDAVQSAGKVPLDVRALGVDSLALSAHKLGGPQGVGCLWVRQGLRLSALIRGGGQETNRRAGTEAVALIAGFGTAARLAAAELPGESARIRTLRDELEARLRRQFPGIRFHARRRERLPNTANFALPGFLGEDLVVAMDLEGIAISTGSACAAGTVHPSHVLEAIGCTSDEARSTLRVSLGRGNTGEDLDRFVAALARRLPPEASACVPDGSHGMGAEP